MIDVEIPTLALSLTQPWAFLMLELPPEQRKNVENRSWNTRVRGDVWVHASKKMTRDDYEGAIETAGLVLGVDPVVPRFEEIKRGGIVGRFRIVDVLPPRDRQGEFELARTKSRSWHFTDSFGFIVRDAKPVPFVPCAGALGFWRVPPAVLAQLRKDA